MTVLITLTTAGADTGPFNLYSDTDGYVTPFETSISKASLVSGYTSTVVPNSTTIIRVRSTSVLCTNYVDLTIVISTTTTTSTTAAPTTTTTTTAAPATTTTTTTQATATLTFTGYASGVFYFDLSAAVGATTTISQATVNGSDGTTCTPINETDDIISSGGDLVITAGSTSGSRTGGSPMTCGTHSFRRGTTITVNGVSKSDGQTLVIGSTLVTVVIPNTCETPYAC